jgi:hypothetical protein
MTNKQIIKQLDRLIPKDVDILHEIATDRIFCSRQSIVNWLSQVLEAKDQQWREKMMNIVNEILAERPPDINPEFREYNSQFISNLKAKGLINNIKDL